MVRCWRAPSRARPLAELAHSVVLHERARHGHVVRRGAHAVERDAVVAPATNPQALESRIEVPLAASRSGRSKECAGRARGGSQAQHPEPTAMPRRLGRGFGAAVVARADDARGQPGVLRAEQVHGALPAKPSQVKSCSRPRREASSDASTRASLRRGARARVDHPSAAAARSVRRRRRRRWWYAHGCSNSCSGVPPISTATQLVELPTARGGRPQGSRQWQQLRVCKKSRQQYGAHAQKLAQSA